MTALERYDRGNPNFGGSSARNAEARTKRVANICRGIVLDIGCGLGYLADYIKDREEVKRYYGLDYGGQTIKENKARFRGDKIHFECMDITKQSLFTALPIAPDIIVCNEFLEHIEKPYQEELLKQIKGQFDLQGYGKLVGTTPKQPTEGPNKKGNHYHVWEHTYDSLKEMFDKVFGDSYEILIDVWFGNASHFEVTKK